jgi:hypothetical protein
VLTLQHQYQHPPPGAGDGAGAGAGAGTPSNPFVLARVNVDLVLERLTAEQMTVGAWVNVMGYVTGVAAPVMDKAASNSSVAVQALLLWSTGPLDVQAYERQLSGMLSLGSSGT